MRLGETPVPIPNTMVKTQAADGTALETVWESRCRQVKKEERQKSEGSFRIMNLKRQPTNARKGRAESSGIDTGKDEQQLIAANPISRAVLL